MRIIEEQQHDQELCAQAVGAGLAVRYFPITIEPLSLTMQRILMRLASVEKTIAGTPPKTPSVP